MHTHDVGCVTDVVDSGSLDNRKRSPMALAASMDVSVAETELELQVCRYRWSPTDIFVRLLIGAISA